MKKKIQFIFLIFLIQKLSYAQDARVSQIMNMPMVLNPANTGNFDGDLRAGVSFARLNNGSYSNNYYGALTNNIYNIGVEHKLGQKKEWAVGINFMHSGSNNFIISGNYTSISFSRNFNFDTANIYSLRIGTQLSYLTGVADESRGGYSILMDVTAFQYYRPTGTDWLRKFRSEYVNINFGAVFNIDFDKLKFQTGISAQNNFKPIFGIMYNSDRTKRIRGSLISSVTFKPNQNNIFRLDHLSWKEGLFFNGPSPVTDTSDLHETTFGFSWTNILKSNRTIGVYSRSAKSMFIIAGIDLKKGLALNFSYEHPFNRRYYNVSQYGISLIYKSGNKN